MFVFLDKRMNQYHTHSKEFHEQDLRLGYNGATCLNSNNEIVTHNHAPANNIFSDVLSHFHSLSSPFLSRGSILTFGNFHS